MARTVLHIGAHKTATTYLQHKLAMNEAVLSEHGVFFLPLDVLRKAITGKLNHPQRMSQTVVAQVKREMKTKTVILSDENIAGVPAQLIRSGRLYTHVGDRLKSVCTALDVKDPEIFLSLRDYPSFVVSMYSEYLRGNAYLKFDRFHDAFKRSTFSWQTVIKDIGAAMPGVSITVWDFAEFRNKETRILSSMLGFDAAGCASPKNRVRQSYSATAHKAIAALATVLEESELQRAMRFMARAFPKNDTNGPFEPINAETTATMSATYQADLAEISGKFKNVTVL